MMDMETEGHGEFCEWARLYDDLGHWSADCQQLPITDNPEVVDYKFCPYCGERIKITEVKQ